MSLGVFPSPVVLLIATAAIISFATITTLWVLQPKVALAAGFTVNSTADALDANPGDGVCDDGAGNCTLRAAIMEANALAGPDTITVPAATYTLSIAGTGEDSAAAGDLDITDDLTIIGAGWATTIIDGAALDRVFDVLPGNTVEIQDVTIKGGRNVTARGGGGILNRGTLTVTASRISGNTAVGNPIFFGAQGGGIANDNGTLTLVRLSEPLSGSRATSLEG